MLHEFDCRVGHVTLAIHRATPARKNSYPVEHEAIIEVALWNEVLLMLEDNTKGCAAELADAQHAALLRPVRARGHGRAKRKGMWMGGNVPLGYVPDGRTLIINEAEAETVRTVFRLYLEHGNVRKVREEADRLRLTTKVRRCVNGNMRGGQPLSRGYIYKLLSNPLYVGRIAHKGKTYDGQHPAIIDAETWDAVQAKLATNTRERRSRAREPSPLAGKLFDETSVALTPSHAVKSGRRYRYYVSRNLNHHPGESGEAKVGNCFDPGVPDVILFLRLECFETRRQVLLRFCDGGRGWRTMTLDTVAGRSRSPA